MQYELPYVVSTPRGAANASAPRVVKNELMYVALWHLEPKEEPLWSLGIPYSENAAWARKQAVRPMYQYSSPPSAPPQPRKDPPISSSMPRRLRPSARRTAGRRSPRRSSRT